MSRNFLLWLSVLVVVLLLGSVSCGKFGKKCQEKQKETECFESKGCKFSCEEDNGALSHSCSCASGEESTTKSSARASSKKGGSSSTSAYASASASSSKGKHQKERTAEF